MNRTIRLSVRAILRAATRLITRRVPRTARAGRRDLYFRARTSVQSARLDAERARSRGGGIRLTLKGLTSSVMRFIANRCGEINRCARSTRNVAFFVPSWRNIAAKSHLSYDQCRKRIRCRIIKRSVLRVLSRNPDFSQRSKLFGSRKFLLSSVRPCTCVQTKASLTFRSLRTESFIGTKAI